MKNNKRFPKIKILAKKKQLIFQLAVLKKVYIDN